MTLESLAQEINARRTPWQWIKEASLAVFLWTALFIIWHLEQWMAKSERGRKILEEMDR